MDSFKILMQINFRLYNNLNNNNSCTRNNKKMA